MTLRDQIVQQALSLPRDDREFVADLLEGSLPEPAPIEPAVAEAWSREIDRRIDRYDAGATTASDLDVALKHIEAALKAHRAATVRRP